MRQALLGLDLGTSAVKALICDEQGHMLGRGEAEHPIHHPKPGAAEQDPHAWWQATRSAISQAVAAAGAPEIAAIGLTGQMHGTVLLDRDGVPVRPAIIWADSRSADQVQEITSRVGGERLIEI